MSLEAATCANCGTDIPAGAERFEFEGDVFETWCAGCGGEEEKRRADAAHDRLVAQVEELYAERVYRDALGWHFWLITREEIAELASQSGSATGLRYASADILMVVAGPSPSSLRRDTEAYATEDAALIGLAAIKALVAEEMGAEPSR